MQLQNRHNKTAKGFTINEERHKAKGMIRISNPKHPQYDHEKMNTILGLIVHGTTDKLRGGFTFMKKKIRIEHPIDKGFFKEVYVLSDIGKAKLKRLRRMKQNQTVSV